MTEQHPFEPFIPEDSTRLILGSFPGKESTQSKRENDWFYCAARNQFWKILEIVFDRDLSDKKNKQKLFKYNNIAITDILLSCQRSENKNSDENLINKEYNKKAINEILTTKNIKQILFTGKGVHKEFIENFEYPKHLDLVVLPSPSPVYRRLNLQDKAKIYKDYFTKE
jgi:hypoxanthine-DNA glycosylase